MQKKESILAIGAHPDDVELGAFGTLIRWSKTHQVTIVVATNGEASAPAGISRAEEAKRSAEAIGARIIFLEMRDGFVPHDLDTVSRLDAVIRDVKPARILIHHPDDLHQDHRHLSLAGISAGRKAKEIWLYETPSTTKSFTPNFFVNISEEIKRKYEVLLKHQSQRGKPYLSEQSIFGTAAYRALSINKVDAYYEAFEVMRYIIE